MSIQNVVDFGQATTEPNAIAQTRQSAQGRS
jgi:hypothetical protein